ncbi:hypothetical protein HYQ46_009051 [Verticillium longisporum]|nr:hypothetical protein HYQ46_009051 [Verticillium longisporum]
MGCDSFQLRPCSAESARDVVEAPVEITRSLNTLCEKLARLKRLGGIHVSRAGVVALDPDLAIAGARSIRGG